MSDKDQYIIVDNINKEFFKDENGNIKIFETFDDVHIHCGFYKFENVWICKLMYNYKEDEEYEQSITDYNRMEEEWEMDNYNEMKDEQQ